MRISSGCKMRLCKQRASLCAQHTAGTQPRLAPVAAETGTSHHPAAGTSLPFPVQYSAVAKGMNSWRTTELSYLSAGGALAKYFLPSPSLQLLIYEMGVDINASSCSGREDRMRSCVSLNPGPGPITGNMDEILNITAIQRFPCKAAVGYI